MILFHVALEGLDVLIARLSLKLARRTLNKLDIG